MLSSPSRSASFDLHTTYTLPYLPNQPRLPYKPSRRYWLETTLETSGSRRRSLESGFHKSCSHWTLEGISTHQEQSEAKPTVPTHSSYNRHPGGLRSGRPSRSGGWAGTYSPTATWRRCLHDLRTRWCRVSQRSKREGPSPGLRKVGQASRRTGGPAVPFVTHRSRKSHRLIKNILVLPKLR